MRIWETRKRFCCTTATHDDFLVAMHCLVRSNYGKKCTFFWRWIHEYAKYFAEAIFFCILMWYLLNIKKFHVAPAGKDSMYLSLQEQHAHFKIYLKDFSFRKKLKQWKRIINEDIEDWFLLLHQFAIFNEVDLSCSIKTGLYLIRHFIRQRFLWQHML